MMREEYAAKNLEDIKNDLQEIDRRLEQCKKDDNAGMVKILETIREFGLEILREYGGDEYENKIN